jgi:hypothetical protein
MNTHDIFGLEYKIGSKCYLLTKTELRCIDQSKPKNNFSIPLNQIDPYYSYGGSYSIIYILFIAYISFAVIARTAQWLYGSQQFTTSANTQLIIFSIFLLYAGWKSYHQLKACRLYQFVYLRDGSDAFAIPVNKQTKEKIQVFLNALVNRIHQVIPSNEHVLVLLDQYNLLTHTEYAQLDANILHSQSETKHNTNVIPLTT